MAKSTNRLEICRRIKALRDDIKPTITAKDFAKLPEINIPYSTYQGYEYDRIPNPEYMKRIRDYHNVTLEYIFEGNPSKVIKYTKISENIALTDEAIEILHKGAVNLRFETEDEYNNINPWEFIGLNTLNLLITTKEGRNILEDIGNAMICKDVFNNDNSADYTKSKVFETSTLNIYNSIIKFLKNQNNKDVLNCRLDKIQEYIKDKWEEVLNPPTIKKETNVDLSKYEKEDK